MIEVPKETCVLVYGDSLSMPRMTEGVLWSDLYSEKFRFGLEEHRLGTKVYLVNRSRGGASISTLYKDYLFDYPYFDSAKDKILIIQSGIVDCAPRPIPDWIKFIISRLPSFVGSLVIQLLHNNRARLLNSGFKWRTTSPYVFRSVFKQWLHFASTRFSKIYVFSILPTNKKTETHSPGYNKSVEVYNAIIKRVIQRTASGNIRFLDLHRFLSSQPELLEAVINSKDGHHLTPAGHEYLFKALAEAELSGCENTKECDKVVC